ncbi:MAG: LPP20 family lipoprotein [Betaproteobacteria bacterium]|nr:LPP20 family lipoprotein [Betaproteobacteria bacterium]
MRKPILLALLLLLSLSGCLTLSKKSAEPVAAAPSWVLSPPKDSSEWYWGVGEGPELDAARRAALKDVAAKLRVSISGSLENKVSVRNDTVDRQARSRVSEEVQKTEFSHFAVDKTAPSPQGFYALVKVDRLAFLRDTQAKLDNADAAVNAAVAGLEAKSPIEAFLALRRAQPGLEKAIGYTQLLSGADAGFKGADRLRRYEGYLEQGVQAGRNLVFDLRSGYDDGDLAAAVGQFVNDSGMRTGRAPGGASVEVSASQRAEDLFGSKIVKLNVALTVRDGQERTLASRTYAVSGASVKDHRAARQGAVQKLLEALREAGPVAGLGFRD